MQLHIDVSIYIQIFFQTLYFQVPIHLKLKKQQQNVIISILFCLGFFLGYLYTYTFKITATY